MKWEIVVKGMFLSFEALNDKSGYDFIMLKKEYGSRNSYDTDLYVYSMKDKKLKYVNQPQGFKGLTYTKLLMSNGFDKIFMFENKYVRFKKNLRRSLRHDDQYQYKY